MSGTGYEDYAFIADLYDDVAAYRTRPDVTFFVEQAQEAGGPVLELGCGTGRVLVPTARAGVEIVGLDLSAHMLNVCRERLRAEPEEVQRRVQLIEGDMRRFELQREFALATLPFRPFQHLLTVHDQLECLGAIRRHLVERGRLVLDIFNPWPEFMVGQPVGEEFGEEAAFTTADGRTVIRRHKIVAVDRFNQISQFELVYYVTHPDGREERLSHPFPLRHLYRFEAEHLLERAGFSVEQLYAGYSRQPFGSVYPGELVFVVRKAS